MSEQLARLKTALAGRYAIDREIGSGGAATVYLADDLKHGRRVALKVLRPELAAALGPERFLREIQVAATLQHPHILPLYDSGEADGLLYYVMPFVEGHSLREKLAREGELPVADAIRILRDVVDALTEAHAHNVVHRDIKPENVLLRGRHALVTDFGVAKAVNEATGRGTSTTAGTALGTPGYMAPEQAAADPHLDHRVDIYAVGAVAYELLTGRPPFTGTTQVVLASHLTETPAPVSRYRATVPAALEALVMRCLAKKPADRWQTADELLAQLEALLTPSGGITPRDTRPVAAPRPGRRRVTGARAAAALGLAGVAVVLVLWGRSRVRPVAADRSVAVLQFRQLGGDSGESFLSAGLAEDVATTLGRVRQIAVKTPAAVARAEAATPGDLRAIGQALDVRYLVDGSLRSFTDSIRIAVRLVDAARETQAWSGTYDRAAGDLLRVPAEIARDLAVRLAGDLDDADREALERRPTRIPEAYEAYLRGNVKFFMRTADANRSAIEDYQRALVLDPGFAAARARIAMLQAQQHDYGWYDPGIDPKQLLAAALALADSAIEGTPTLSDGWTARCYVLYQMGRYPAASDACDRALALNPRDLEANNRRGWVRLELGLDSGAAADGRRCVEVDPTWHIAFFLLGRIAFDQGRMSEALQDFDESVRRAPSYRAVAYWRGRARLWIGDTAGAADDLRLLAVPSLGIERATLQGLLDARAGRRDAARVAAAGLARQHRVTEAALVYAALREFEPVLEVLESGAPWWSALRGPEFGPLRSDGRFQRVVAAARARAATP